MRHGLSLLLIAVSAAVASAQVTPAMVNAPAAPLALVSTTADLGDFLSAVTLRNVSGKAVSRFQLGYIKIVAAGCGPVAVVAPEERFAVDRVAVESGAEVVTRSYRLAPGVIQSFGQEHGATDVQTQLAVVSVWFADGSTWSFPRTSRVYDERNVAQNAALRCGTLPKQ